MDTTRRILLKRSVAETTFPNYGAYRIRIDVEEVRGEDLDPCIFIYRRGNPNPYTGVIEDKFEAIAGPAQLRDYPVDDPDPDQGWPMFRKSHVILDFISAQPAEEFYAIVQNDADMLCEALNHLDRLQVVDNNWIPGPPEDDSESSASSSA